MPQKSRAKWKPGPVVTSLAALDAVINQYEAENRPQHLLLYMWRGRVLRPLSWAWVQNLQVRVLRDAIKRGFVHFAVPRDKE